MRSYPFAGRWSIPGQALLTAGLTAVLVAPSGVAGDWKGKMVTGDGATEVQNPSAAVEPLLSVELDELWRIGGDTDDENEFFGVISEIVHDDEGRLYLVDAQLSEVKVFDAEGAFVRAIGREGEGPGEFRNPSDVFLLPGGNVGVLQLFPGRIVELTPTGEPVRDFPLPETQGGGFMLLINGEGAGDHLVLAAATSTPGEGRMVQHRYLAAVDAEGKELCRYYGEDRVFEFASMKIDENVWDTFDRRWTVGPDGRVYAVVKNGDYAVHVWSPDGSKDRVIRREFTPIPRSDEEREDVLNVYKAFTENRVPNATYEISDFHRTIEQLYVRDDGSLWVLSSTGSRERPDGVVGVFDVFDAEGRFVRQVALQGEGDPLEDGYFFVGDRFFVVTGFLDAAMAAQGAALEEDEEEPLPMEVICYRLDGDVVALK
jgi:hypothetical protein